MKGTLIGIVMGSASDYETLASAEDVLNDFDIAYEIAVVSAHRTPKLMYEYATSAEERGLAVIIAGAGGAAHLPGMLSSLTTLPVLGVPIKSKALKGMDSLLSIVQMPAGIPTATFAIGTAGATNAALFAIQILALNDPLLKRRLAKFREQKAALALKGNETVQKRSREKGSAADAAAVNSESSQRRAKKPQRAQGDMRVASASIKSHAEGKARHPRSASNKAGGGKGALKKKRSLA